MAVAATAMRRVLVDYARARRTSKRGGGRDHVNLDDVDLPSLKKDQELIGLDEALQRLNELSPRQAKVVEMRYFAGLNENEIAAVLGLTTRTVARDWKMARAWLHQHIRE
jgi:RNA polymerase sigma factor (TIGR02999 family)